MTYPKEIIVSAHQPHYLPWLGYIDKVRQADIFCLIDTIPFETDSFQAKNKIRIYQEPGEEMLALPVIINQPRQLILDTNLEDQSDWAEAHWQKIQTAYKKAPYFSEYADFFEDLYAKKWNRLTDVAEYMLQGILQFFGIKTRVVRASTLDVWEGHGNIHVEICRKLAGTVYLSGAGKCLYLDPEALKKAGIPHRVQDFHHPVYPQVHGSFISKLAALDLLFNCGQAAIDFLVHE